MSLAERAVGALVRSNNSHIRWVDPISANPRDVTDCPLHVVLSANYTTIRTEWLEFADAGGRLPHIEDLLGESQGNEGAWRAGVLTTNGACTRLGTSMFPGTCAALSGVPGVKAALWSVLDAGTSLVEHRGPNAGVLRYHLGVDCPPGSELQVGDTRVPYRDGAGILFDDTERHAAWNRSAAPRVTLFCEIERPLPAGATIRNRLVQAIIGTDPRRRRINRLADDWNDAMNRGLVASR